MYNFVNNVYLIHFILLLCSNIWLSIYSKVSPSVTGSGSHYSLIMGRD